MHDTHDFAREMLFFAELEEDDIRRTTLVDYFADTLHDKMVQDTKFYLNVWCIDDGAYYINMQCHGMEWWALGVCNTPEYVCYSNRLEMLRRPLGSPSPVFIRCGRDIADDAGRALWTLAFLHRTPPGATWQNHMIRAYRPGLGRGEWVYFYCNQHGAPTVLSSNDVRWMRSTHEKHYLSRW